MCKLSDFLNLRLDTRYRKKFIAVSKKGIRQMKLITTTFACLLTVSTASVALADEKASLPAAGSQNSGATPVTVEPANAVVAAGAAQVINQTGAVTRVNRGEGLVELSTGTDLSVGDTVFAGPGSTVTLYYPATGCEHVVPSETYFAVASTPPCSTSAGVSMGSGLQKSASSSAAISSGETDNTKTALLVGSAVVVAGGVLAVIALNGNGDDNNNDNPASPD